jgi:hypothetical protein
MIFIIRVTLPDGLQAFRYIEADKPHWACKIAAMDISRSSVIEAGTTAEEIVSSDNKVGITVMW